MDHLEPEADPDEIRRAVRLLVPAGAVVEMRVLETHQKTVSGYFNDVDALVEHACRWNAKGIAVYLTLNPVKPALLARAANRAKGWVRATTSDNDIERRCWLGIDFDPIRPSGISATSEERAAAILRARQCKDWLTEQGWPLPAFGDSGNGAHLLYAITLPSDDVTRRLLEGVLKALSQRFSDDAVKVDETTFNAARIWKLYGTAACKGDSTPDRPHRLAELLEVPDCMEVVSREQLAALVPGPAPRPEPKGHASFQAGGEFDLAAWIARSGLAVVSDSEWNGGHRWVLNPCPWNPDHTNRAAYIVQLPSGAIDAGCHHDGCKENGWRDLREMVDGPSRNGFRPETVTSGLTIDGRSADFADIAAYESDFGNQEWGLPIPFHEHDLPPFPTHALPDWLGEYVRAEAEATQTPQDLAGMLCLAALAVAAQKKVVVRAREGWTEPVNLFVVVALPPGARKSAVFSDVIGPLVSYEEEMGEEIAAEAGKARNHLDILRGRLKRLQDQAAKATPEEAPDLERQCAVLVEEVRAVRVPALPRLIADDVTPEKLASMIAEQEGRMGVMSPEGDIFDLMAGRYSDKANFAVFLRGHSGDTLRVDRHNRAAEYVKSPALTLGLAVQPDVIRGLAEKRSFRGRGLLARFLYALPRDLLGRREMDPAPVSSRIRETYHRHLTAILYLPFRTDDNGKPAPHTLRISDGAQRLLTDFSRWLEPQLEEFGSLGHLTDWAGKLAGAITRIAGLLHLAAHYDLPAPWDRELGQATMERAICIGSYLIPHVRFAYALIGADPVVDEARHITAWMQRQGGMTFTKRDVFNGVRGRFKRVEAMEPALSLLVAHEYLREHRSRRKPGAGRPAGAWYELNPHLRESEISNDAARPQYTQNPQIRA